MMHRDTWVQAKYWGLRTSIVVKREIGYQIISNITVCVYPFASLELWSSFRHEFLVLLAGLV